MQNPSFYDIAVEELDETYPQADPVSSTGIRLWPHQLTLLQRCKAFENQKLLLKEFDSLKQSHPDITDTDYLRTQVGVIGDPVGSGKSYVVLALIKDNDISNFGSTVKSFGSNKVVFCYSERNVNIKTNLLVIPHNLVNQWESYIQAFASDMKVMIISKMKHTEKLYESETDIPSYDLLVVTSTYYTRIAHVLTSRSYKMQRVIFDEIDHINLPNCIAIESNFYWFVSASFGNLLYPRGYSKYDNRLMRTMTYAVGIRNSGFVKDLFMDLSNKLSKEMVKLLIVKNKESYIRESVTLPPMNVSLVRCKTPLSITVLEGYVDREVIMSLNAGDLVSAMQRISSSQTSNEENIIQTLVEKYVRETRNLDLRIETTRQMEYDSAEQKETEIKRLTQRKSEFQNRIDGIKDRVKSTDTCCVCYDTITKKTVTRCCSNVYCFLCINIWLSQNNTCPLCKTRMLATDLLIVDENCTQDIIDDGEVHESFDKMKNLEVILKNSAPDSKFLVYSSYDMTFTTFVDVLDKLGIAFAYLKGPETHIRRTIERYKDGEVRVLLVNGRNYGAGLNLECTTDVVMFHKMETESEKQIIGRAQRWPRTTSLNVHYLLYQNEIDHENLSI
jgi:SNF2 family DNA or RNA helicase